MIRKLAVLLFASLPAFAAEKDVIAVVQALFDGMAAHDAAAISATMLPDARLVAVQDSGAATSISRDDFAARIGGAKGDYLERIWEPKVLLKGRIAQVWAEYDFHLNGTFNHCGIDSVSLLETKEGWKISGISYTSEKANCTPSPLGPPKK